MSMQISSRRVRFLEPTQTFRTKLLYNNVMFVVAAVVAETLGGGDLSWEELMIRDTFFPLGMFNSSFIHTAGPDFSGIAIPYLRLGEDTVISIPFQGYR